ncbi:tail tube protein [Vibrio phage vB_VhaM_VH-8]|nr:tail tube protein [Vibrio phage vB_VhaM_VH-8]
MLYSYIPSSIKCKVFGVELVGLSKDSIVTIERINEVNTFRKAQDGTHTAFTDFYGSYRVTLHIEQVSESNDFLHTIFKLHKKSGLNLVIPLDVEERVPSGGTSFTSFDTFFETEPMTEFTSESGSRQWTFICNNASYQLNGTKESSFLTESLKATIRLIELSQSAGIDLSSIEDMIDRGIDETQARLKNMF